MTSTQPSNKLAVAVVLLRAFASRARVTPRRVREARVSRPAVEVNSDFGFAPIFPPMR